MEKININTKTDEEIKKLFDDESITYDSKSNIIEHYKDRINKLPFDIFLNILFYLNDPNVLRENYLSKIEGLSYEELTTLIYDGNLDPECLLIIIELPIFKKYLSYEKEIQKETKLQSFALLSEIYLCKNDLIKLENVLEKIDFLLKSATFSEDIEFLINASLETILGLNVDINTDNRFGQSIINFMNYYYKNHHFLSANLMEGYIRIRLEDLKLTPYCNRIDFNHNITSTFGHYQLSEKTLTIYKNYFLKRFKLLFKQFNYSEEKENDFLNIMWLYMCSHELCHIIRAKEIEELGKDFSLEQIKENTSLYYWYKNNLLQITDETTYQQYHNKFIEEIRANIFGCFDSIKQVNERFKDSFPQNTILSFNSMHAREVLNYYSEEQTPMQKFDEFFKESIPDEEFSTLSKDSNDLKPEEIFENLLLGDNIPTYVLEELKKVGNGEMMTYNLQEHVEESIKKHQKSL